MRFKYFDPANRASTLTAMRFVAIRVLLLLLDLRVSALHAAGLAVPQQEKSNPGEDTVATQGQEATEFTDALDALDKRVESWIYYHRPLRNAERSSYEFFYKPGEEAIEVHPTIDRVAFLLRRPGVDLHWLTTNRSIEDTDGWIATSNVAVEPECRRGPSPLPLKINDWNTCVVEIRDGIVRLRVLLKPPSRISDRSKFILVGQSIRASGKIRIYTRRTR